jgi:hypothetical protein
LAPQVPKRHRHQLESAYITGSAAVLIRLQFDPLASGKVVVVRPGKGLILESAQAVLRIGSTGECAVSVRIEDTFSRSHILFFCEGVTSTLPLTRATPQIVAAKKNAEGRDAR